MAARRAANFSGAVGSATVAVPAHHKARGWEVKPRQVAYYRDETEADAIAFGDIIRASFNVHHAAELERRSLPTQPVAPCKHAYGAGEITGPHVAGCKYLEPRGPFANIPFVAQAEPVKARKPRVVKAEPAPLDPMQTCNACDMRPMVGPEHPGYAAGLCAECYAEATAPEPVQEAPSAPETAEEAPEPVLVAEPTYTAPVAVPNVTRERPTCERCGQVFRLHGTGYAWHLANRPDCAAGRLSVVA